MRMRFDSDDDDGKAFFVRRDEQFAQWLAAQRVAGDPNDAALLMDWKWNCADGALDAWAVVDVSGFLFHWCVRKLSASPQDAAEVPDSVAAFVEFLAHRGLLAPVADPPSRIRSYCTDNTRRFVREMHGRAGRRDVHGGHALQVGNPASF